MQIPNFIEHIFWDTDKNSIDLQKDKWFIVERVVNYGNLSSIKWLFSCYTANEIAAILQENYNISVKALNLWSQLLQINPTECKCLQRPLALNVFS